MRGAVGRSHVVAASPFVWGGHKKKSYFLEKISVAGHTTPNRCLAHSVLLEIVVVEYDSKLAPTSKLAMKKQLGSQSLVKTTTDPPRHHCYAWCREMIH